MEVITEIERNGTRFTVSFDSGEKIMLTRSLFYELGLTENMHCDLAELKKKITVLQYRAGLNSAVAMLAQRACSKGEIEQKLKNLHYLPDTIEMVLYKLEREGFLDDEDFARQWTESRLNQGKYGRKKIAFELKRKGVSEEQIRSALEDTDPEQELESAVNLAQKFWVRRKTDEDPRKAKQRIFAMLCRRGFGYDVVRQAIEALSD